MRQALGTAVFFGMIGVTVFGLCSRRCSTWSAAPSPEDLPAPAQAPRRRRPRRAARRGGWRPNREASRRTFTVRGVSARPASSPAARSGPIIALPPPRHPGSPASSPPPRIAAASYVGAGSWRLVQDPSSTGGAAGLLHNTDLRTRRRRPGPGPRPAEPGAGQELFRPPAKALAAISAARRWATSKPAHRASARPMSGLTTRLWTSPTKSICSARCAAASKPPRPTPQAAAAAEDLVRITVAAETARAYADAAPSHEQADVARQSVQIEQQTFDIALRQRDAGAASDLDVARAGDLLDQTRAQIPTLEGQRRRALFQLAVLTGRPPELISPEAEACAAPPGLNQPIPWATARPCCAVGPTSFAPNASWPPPPRGCGVAVANLFPSVTLGARDNRRRPHARQPGSISRM